jgi:hypothetical protein
VPTRARRAATAPASTHNVRRLPDSRAAAEISTILKRNPTPLVKP